MTRRLGGRPGQGPPGRRRTGLAGRPTRRLASGPARRLAVWVVVCVVGGALRPPAAEAQDGQGIRVVGSGGEVRTVATSIGRGYEALPATSLRDLGWEVVAGPGAWLLRHPSGARVALVPGDPFFRWDEAVLQLVDPPYLERGDLWVPAQLVLDFLPFRLPEEYAYRVGPRGPELVLRPAGAGERGAGEPDIPPVRGEAGASGARRPSGRPERRVVIIDPGHGGRDLGALGPGGTREKDVALAVGLALARELERYPGLEVHLTRKTDVLVPLWQRGEWATEVKGERPGVFISIHANAMPTPSPTRGFETYFLSEARTEHERRVAAMENAPLALPEEGNGRTDPGLGGILRELRNLDHQHWSALLAELVQQRLAPVHPGPDRGVKQAPFAVITNAVMPAVLVEVGFMSNRQEERLLGRESFHEDVATALAEAVVDFFQRYPPGSGTHLEAAGDAGSGS